eukprot:scaffold298799_cov18-Prasinocladus_malaysianus.AAC.1
MLQWQFAVQAASIRPHHPSRKLLTTLLEKARQLGRNVRPARIVGLGMLNYLWKGLFKVLGHPGTSATDSFGDMSYRFTCSSIISTDLAYGLTTTVRPHYTLKRGTACLRLRQRGSQHGKLHHIPAIVRL